MSHFVSEGGWGRGEGGATNAHGADVVIRDAGSGILRDCVNRKRETTVSVVREIVALDTLNDLANGERDSFFISSIACKQSMREAIV